MKGRVPVAANGDAESKRIRSRQRNRASRYDFAVPGGFVFPPGARGGCRASDPAFFAEAAVKKIQLQPESLQVQSFVVPADVPRGRGTVAGRQLQTRPFVQCYSQHSCVYPCTDNPEECI